MARAKARPPPPPDYLARTRELPVNLLFLAPWVVLYQLCLVGSASRIDNAAAAWLGTLARTLGRDGLIATGLLVSLLLVTAVLVRLREAPRDRGLYGGMLFEGLVYGAMLGVVARALASGLPLGRMVLLGPDLALLRMRVEDLGLALGAGVFEELLFRGFLLAGLLVLLRDALGTDRITAAVVSTLVAAWVFSAYHHWGPGGEPWHAGVFAFRFWAGVALGAVFLWRGLGIAALAHGSYDVLVLWSR